MVKLQFSISLSYEIYDNSSDFIFNIEAARTPHQTVVNEQLTMSQNLIPLQYTDPASNTRYLRLEANQGHLQVHYNATVDISHHTASHLNLQEMRISQLPSEALQYIYPSRYCQSDRLQKLANREFGHLQHGYQRVVAIQDWVRQRTAFLSGTTNSSTSAIDTITELAGVCRDFAHLMIALCRALNLPARFVTGIDYGADPILGPTDFHAYVEVMLGGRWYLFDPSGVSPPMGLVRLGTGRDAADVAFATVFGSVGTHAPIITIEAIEDLAQGWELPQHRTDALSTA